MLILRPLRVSLVLPVLLAIHWARPADAGGSGGSATHVSSAARSAVSMHHPVNVPVDRVSTKPAPRLVITRSTKRHRASRIREPLRTPLIVGGQFAVGDPPSALAPGAPITLDNRVAAAADRPERGSFTVEQTPPGVTIVRGTGSRRFLGE